MSYALQIQAMNNSDALVNELSSVLATEQRGLVCHIANATPYVSPKTYKLFVALKEMAHQGIDHAQRITQFMQRHELQPKAVTFDAQVANFHFVSLESVLPELISEKQNQIAAYQRAIEHLGDDLPDARDELQALLNENKRQLTELESSI